MQSVARQKVQRKVLHGKCSRCKGLGGSGKQPVCVRVCHANVTTPSTDLQR